MNDVASVNIDAKLIRGAAGPREGQVRGSAGIQCVFAFDGRWLPLLLLLVGAAASFDCRCCPFPCRCCFS